MSCTGSVTRLSAGGSGQVTRLSCCGNTPTQQQELVRLWKQRRRDLFTTVPLPYGRSSFHSVAGGGMVGPPKPGDEPTDEDGDVVPPPPDIPGRVIRQKSYWPGGIGEW